MNNSPSCILFISGIDTNSGKTIATGLLAAYLKKQGKNIITQKLVQTGCTGIAEDIITHRTISGMPLTEEDRDRTTCPFVFKKAASPHLAAETEGKKIDIDKIEQATKQLAKKYDTLLIEGAGGLHVPITRETFIIDLLEEKKYPVILVTTPQLGSINQTLTSLEVLKHRNIPLAALIYNNYPQTDLAITRDSRTIFRDYLDKNFDGVPLIDIPKIKHNTPPSIDFSAISTT